MTSARFSATIDADWQSARRLKAGLWLTPDRVTDIHVLVDGPDGRLVIDVFGPLLQSFTFSAVELWHGLVVIGYGSALHVVRPSNGWSLYVAIPGYFSSLYMGDAATDVCLVATDCGIIRLSPEGQVVWKREDLAADGVIISDVEDGVIKASGQWDPPDADWMEFQLNLETGARLP
jgi:hypothetical protein